MKETAKLRYLEDLAVGQLFGSGSLTVDADQIVAFAKEFDPQPFHIDPEAAPGTFFRGLAASGWHTAALTMRLLVEGETRLAGGIIGVSGEISWPRPTRPGDTLTLESEVLEIVPSKSKPDRGMVTVRTTTYNQNREPVQVSMMKLLAFRRPPAD